ncbi:MAG: hypothetical protein COY39_05770 [Alphaproteobacteria bacterium CG_4_10_14_0_8_um_filter_37_21]|nr:MAG: hypothetical protein COY39_05770 [Alphaproteobacteria bacterium CG_4_10_14_0_8_um_filter_37_21]
MAHALEKPGDMYMSLLQMCVMPLLMVSMINAISHVVSARSRENTTVRFLCQYLSMTLVLVLLSILLAEIFRTGYPISDNAEFLRLGSSGENVHTLLVSVDDQLDRTQSLIDLIRSIFTSNIFDSLQGALILQVILFSALVGSAAGFLNGRQKESFSTFIASCNTIFKMLIGWITNFLPIGIICMFSIKFLNFSSVVFEIFFSSILCLISSIFVIVLVLNIFIAQRLQIKYFSIFSKMRNVMTISASTGSPIATMPTYMKALVKEFEFNQNKVDLYIPLSIALFRSGNVFYFGYVSVLIAQIFAIPLGFYDYINLMILVCFAGFASVSSGIINVGLLAMILSPISVPSSLAITLFMALDPIIDPFRAAFTMYMHLFCAAFSLADKKNKIEKVV